MPDSGLAIWHVDEDGSNNDEQMTPSNHYECSLVQADNQLELEKNVNQGDLCDLFSSSSRSAFTDSTEPASRWWDGTPSGLAITGIGAPGPQMTFQVDAVAGGGNVDGKSTPNKAIPDFDTTGISDQIVLAGSGAGQDLVESIRVSVSIKHSYRGDLRVTLVAPSGVAAVLHDRAGGSADDIEATFDATNAPVLSALVNQPVAGAWALSVQDLAPADPGTLKAWSIDIKTKAGGAALGPIELSETPGIRIPDNDPNGIVRSLQCAQTGKVSEVRVDLDMAHTYTRDLIVTLESPHGTRVDLHHRGGGSADNIIRSFDEQDTPGLSTFRGEDVQGSWKLRVSDHEAADIGKLNRWTLKLFRQP